MNWIQSTVSFMFIEGVPSVKRVCCSASFLCKCVWWNWYHFLALCFFLFFFVQITQQPPSFKSLFASLFAISIDYCFCFIQLYLCITLYSYKIVSYFNGICVIISRIITICSVVSCVFFVGRIFVIITIEIYYYNFSHFICSHIIIINQFILLYHLLNAVKYN